MAKLKRRIPSSLKENIARDYAREQREKENEAYIKQQERQRAYDRTATGKVGGFLSKSFRTLSQKYGVTKRLYKKSMPLRPSYSTVNGVKSRTVQGVSSGRRGRPIGTYNPLYAKYGGVYGYRKAMALERFKQRQAILEQSATNPRQRVILAQIRQRDMARMQDPEGRVIPDTYGQVNLNGIFRDIDDATNLVG